MNNSHQSLLDRIVTQDQTYYQKLMKFKDDFFNQDKQSKEQLISIDK